MRFLTLLMLCLCLAACASGVVYKKAPAAQVDPRSSAMLSGVYLPYGVYFTAVSQFKGDSARVVVLSYMGSKMLDMNVTADEIQIYDKLPQLPARVAAGFGRFVRAKLFTPCPEKQITYYDDKSRGTFEAQAVGGQQCN